MTKERVIELFKEVKAECEAKQTELSKQIFEHEGIEALDMAIKALEQNPKAHGTWKHMGHDEYECPFCGFTFIGDDTEDENFCQFCGADMRAES